jgi:hypothetical protein
MILVPVEVAKNSSRAMVRTNNKLKVIIMDGAFAPFLF